MASKSKPELSQKPKAWAELRDMLHKENADFLGECSMKSVGFAGKACVYI